MCTVAAIETEFTLGSLTCLGRACAVLQGQAVAPTAPKKATGTYWGYQTRLAGSLGAVFSECPFKVRQCAYDAGISEMVD